MAGDGTDYSQPCVKPYKLFSLLVSGDSIMKECSTLDDEYKKIILISNAVSDIESGNKRAIVDILHL